MKRQRPILFGIAFLLLTSRLLTSCAKKDQPAPAPMVVPNTFLADQQVYEVIHSKFGTAYSDYILFSAESRMYNAHIRRQFFVAFKTKPQSDGDYIISGAIMPGDREVRVGTSLDNYQEFTSYGGTGNEQARAAVTVTNGKVRIVVPRVLAKKLVGPGPDSIQIAADIIQE